MLQNGPCKSCANISTHSVKISKLQIIPWMWFTIIIGLHLFNDDTPSGHISHSFTVMIIEIIVFLSSYILEIQNISHHHNKSRRKYGHYKMASGRHVAKLTYENNAFSMPLWNDHIVLLYINNIVRDPEAECLVKYANHILLVVCCRSCMGNSA